MTYSTFICIEVTDDRGTVTAPELLLQAGEVHRQLRPLLPVDSADYAKRLEPVFANGGRMTVLLENGKIYGVAIWRILENTFEGRRFYIDDLVTDENSRSRGMGQTLLSYLEGKARTLNCNILALDSGVQRTSAHKFYFRENLSIFSYSFRKAI